MNAGTAEMTNQPACACQTAFGETIEKFLELRKQCAVIKEILIPDNILDSWEAMARCLEKNASVEAYHKSILLLAYKRKGSQLGKITAPLHRFLFDEGQLRARKQYLQDLKEEWLFQSSPEKRHKKSRGYMGKLMELITAGWLEGQGWKVKQLAALNEASPDIMADDPQGVNYAIEVKYIGQEDEDFANLLRSLKSGCADTRSLSPYVACNYVWFRIYEAALQIVTRPEAKLAVLVIDATAWQNLEPVVRNNWMPSRNYSFYHDEVQYDCAWKAFYLSTVEGDHPGIKKSGSDRFMPTVIKSLSQLKIMKFEEWAITQQYVFTPNDSDHNALCSPGSAP